MIEENFDYITENKLDNDFTNSLRRGYEKHGRLTYKQQTCLQDIVSRHSLLKMFFRDLRDEDRNNFLESLEEQFNKRGFLTPKQISCLKINV